MQNVTDRTRNPFGMHPDCESFVPGYGDANADFHVVGDRPGVHGGADAGVPFTGEPWSATFLSALVEGGLIADFDGGSVTENGEPPDPIRADGTFFSYLHTCVVDGVPDEASYDDMERFFDAELRAIAAHVLLPVGARATDHRPPRVHVAGAQDGDRHGRAPRRGAARLRVARPPHQGSRRVDRRRR